MKKLSIILAVLGLSCASASVYAQEHRVMLGYAHQFSEKEDGFRLKGNGVSLKYNYIWDNDFGVITAFSYLSGSETERDRSSPAHLSIDEYDTKYFSLAIGPSYKINEYFNIYGLVGAARLKLDDDYRDYTGGVLTDKGSDSGKGTSFNYGLGVQVTPYQDFIIDAAFDATSAKPYDDSFKMYTFNINVGYRF